MDELSKPLLVSKGEGNLQQHFSIYMGTQLKCKIWIQ